MNVVLHDGDPEIVVWTGNVAWILRDSHYAAPPAWTEMNGLERLLLVARLRAWADRLES